MRHPGDSECRTSKGPTQGEDKAVEVVIVQQATAMLRKRVFAVLEYRSCMGAEARPIRQAKGVGVSHHTKVHSREIGVSQTRVDFHNPARSSLLYERLLVLLGLFYLGRQLPKLVV